MAFNFDDSFTGATFADDIGGENPADILNALPAGGFSGSSAATSGATGGAQSTGNISFGAGSKGISAQMILIGAAVIGALFYLKKK